MYFNCNLLHIVGGKISQSSTEGIILIDENGIRTILKESFQCNNLTGSLQLMWTHAQDAKNHCLNLEKLLSSMEGSNNFPIIIGRRPVVLNTTQDKENLVRNLILSLR